MSNAQGQLQGEAQGQLQAQLEAQGQLQGQLELQDQKQDQDQDQDQDQKQFQAQVALQGAFQDVKSENENENENENKNENKNENEVENKVESKVDNKVENDIENKVENKVESNVDVDVKVDLDLSTLPDDADVIDIDLKEEVLDIGEDVKFDQSVVTAELVSQYTYYGNNFNIDQINNLVDQDSMDDVEVGDADVEIKAEAEGGEAKIDDIESKIDGDGNTVGDLGGASADAANTISAYGQQIVMGANIQFNSVNINAAGDDWTNDNGVEF